MWFCAVLCGGIGEVCGFVWFGVVWCGAVQVCVVGCDVVWMYGWWRGMLCGAMWCEW